MKHFKKIITGSIILGAFLLPNLALAISYTIPWTATSTTNGLTFPYWNGVYQSVLAPTFIGTSTTAASIFPYASTTAISSSGNAYFGTTAGNVGIASTSPFAKLSIKGVGTGTGFNFQTTNSSDSPLVTGFDNGTLGIGTTTSNFAGTQYALVVDGAITPLLICRSGGVGCTSFSSNNIYSTFGRDTQITAMPRTTTTQLAGIGFYTSNGTQGGVFGGGWNHAGQFFTGTSTSDNSAIATFADTTGIMVLQNAVGSNSGVQYIGRHSRGSLAAPADVANGDDLAVICGSGYSSGYKTCGGQLSFTVDGTFTTGQRVPTKATVFTNLAGNSSLARLTVLSGGNTGVGTTTPFSLLQVAGATPKITLSDTGAGADLKHWYAKSAAGIFTIATTSDALVDTSVPAFTILSSGFTGNNITTPTAQLHVKKNVSGSVAIFESPGTPTLNVRRNDSATASGSFGFQNNAGTNGASIDFNNTVGQGLEFKIGGTVGGYMTATLFGVGSSTPWSRLGVKGNGVGTNPVFSTSGSTDIPGLVVLDNGNTGIASTSPFSTFSIAGNSTTIPLAISTTTATSASTTLFMIDKAGDVHYGGGTPTLSGCGTTPLLDANSTDQAGTVTFGATASGCTITFSVVKASSPHCIVTEQTLSLTNALSYTETATALTLTEASSGGLKVDYFCPLGH